MLVVGDDGRGGAECAPHLGDRGAAARGALGVVVDDHIGEAIDRQAVVPGLGLGVDHADQIEVLEGDAVHGDEGEL